MHPTTYFIAHELTPKYGLILLSHLESAFSSSCIDSSSCHIMICLESTMSQSLEKPLIPERICLDYIMIFLCCRQRYCFNFWCTRDLAQLVVVAIIPTVENWSHSSIMEHSARYVPQEAVVCVRKCGALFNSMPEFAKNHNAICQDAGMVRSFSHLSVTTHSQCTRTSTHVHHALFVLERSNWTLIGNRDQKELWRKLQLMQWQSESRRRAAVNQMMMQRQLESSNRAAGNGVNV